MNLPLRYRAIELLGEGATCEVVLAEDSVSCKQVAIKVVRSNLALHDRFRTRFAREISLLAKLVHPHIVPIYDLGTLDGGQPFVSMAYADRGTLAISYVKNRPSPQWCRSSIKYWRRCRFTCAGLVHQDLKPENVPFRNDENGQLWAWVADLGVAGKG